MTVTQPPWRGDCPIAFPILKKYGLSGFAEGHGSAKECQF